MTADVREVNKRRKSSKVGNGQRWPTISIEREELFSLTVRDYFYLFGMAINRKLCITIRKLLAIV